MVLLYSEQLPLGWEAVDFQLKGTDDKTYSLNTFIGRKGLLLVFTCNHCPYAEAAWPLLIELHKKYGKEIAFAAINPNDDQMYPEDSFESMKAIVKELGLTFPYLHDQSQEIARTYKAQCTPDPYLFKREKDKWKLSYHGRINDNWQEPEKVTKNDLDEAMEKLLKNQDSSQDQPPSMGCSIKWK